MTAGDNLAATVVQDVDAAGWLVQARGEGPLASDVPEVARRKFLGWGWPTLARAQEFEALILRAPTLPPATLAVAKGEPATAEHYMFLWVVANLAAQAKRRADG